ncbi:hypothetical protein EV382_1033 [Micromonospora violae]|uniref:Uncharacterized protein n=2 Tax=Micromonospora violae TaxID=1278207 RepID=A0A4Q7UA54_9ACTN|nr:hypothetical protein EV382_1033 [Micromonospora violae]
MVTLLIRIKDDQSTSEQLDELAIDLREVILESGVGSAERRSGQPVLPGTRGVELLEVGALVVQVALETGLLADVIQRIRDWRGRQQVQHVEIELNGSRLVVSNATMEQQQALVEHFVKSTLEKAQRA